MSDALRFLNDFCADNPTYNDDTIDCTATQNVSQGPETDMNGDGIVSLEDSPLFNAGLANGGPGPGAVVPEDVEVVISPPAIALPGLSTGVGIALLALALATAGTARLRSRR